MNPAHELLSGVYLSISFLPDAINRVNLISLHDDELSMKPIVHVQFMKVHRMVTSGIQRAKW